jgi:hypothetical protein
LTPPIGNVPGVASFNPSAAGALNPATAAAVYNSAALAGLANPYASTTAAYGANGINGQNPYGGGYGYYETESGGFLRGTAELANSQGKWLVSLQQASLLKEQTRQAAIETRKKQYDQTVYEQQRAPSFDQKHESVSSERLLQSRNGAPESEILSGQAQNDILADLAGTAIPRGPAAPLSADLLRHINLTTGPGGGSAGLLKDDALLHWPSALSDEASKGDREMIEALVNEARRQAHSGRVESPILKELGAASRRLHQKLAADIRELQPKQYAESNRFLSQLDDAIRLLGRPDAGDYLTRKGLAEVKDVAELVRNMSGKGLQFAPAIPGDEAAYTALHRALAAYLNSQVAGVGVR